MYDYRAVTTDDLELICEHRRAMFASSGRQDRVLDPMTEAFRPWLEPRLASGAYFGWIAEAAGAPVAGLGMMVIDWPPHWMHPTQASRGYILNIYVKPEDRRRGLAEGLMALAVAEGRRRGIQHMVLHASAMATPMYEKLGWTRTNEMALSLS